MVSPEVAGGKGSASLPADRQRLSTGRPERGAAGCSGGRPGVSGLVQPDQLRARLEIGIFENRLLFDVAAYHIDWSNIQVGANVGGVNVLVNGSYTDPTFSNAVPSIGALPGDRLQDIPEFQGAITVDYYLPLRGGWNSHFGAGLRMVGDRKSAPDSGGSTPGTDFAYPLDSYAALDLGADITTRTGRFVSS